MGVTAGGGGQADLWNGTAGRGWVEAQALTDEVFRPIDEVIVDAIAAGSGSGVLDVGCGTGATTLAVARRPGARGPCVGIDISEPMIAAAVERARREGVPARFIRADAESHAFEPGRFDAIVSRFGVMFFADPVRAFANLRHAARSGGELRSIAWRSAAENPFLTTAERAASGLLPDLPVGQPDAPGRFGFADPRRVHRILTESGWSGFEIRPIDIPCSFAESQLVGYLTRFGPLGTILHELDEATRARVIDTVRPAFDPYVGGAEVRFEAACWMIAARA